MDFDCMYIDVQFIGNYFIEFVGEDKFYNLFFVGSQVGKLVVY